MTPLDELRSKVALFKRLEAEHQFGVIIDDPVPLEPVPDGPPGALEVFSLFSRAEGSFFRFRCPPEITSSTAWKQRHVDDYLPVETPVAIGHEIWTSQQFPGGEIFEGAAISMDPVDGDVYYVSPDDWMFWAEHPDEEVDINELGPDVATFFNEYVFGRRYLELVVLMLGEAAPEHRIRKGRNKGELTDGWTRLLRTAGIISY